MEYNSLAKICTTYDNYDFSKIVLTDPEILHGGSFFTKLNVDNSMFYIQTPKCLSKQGIILTSGKKSYIDLMFSNEHSEFIGFIENLEKACIRFKRLFLKNGPIPSSFYFIFVLFSLQFQ